MIEKPNTSVYAYASYMSDSIIDDGDKSIADAREQFEQGTQWYVSDNYLYLAGSVWVPKKNK